MQRVTKLILFICRQIDLRGNIHSGFLYIRFHNEFNRFGRLVIHSRFLGSSFAFSTQIFLNEKTTLVRSGNYFRDDHFLQQGKT